MINSIDLLLEKYVKGSKRLILFAKTFDEATQESFDIILDEYGFNPQDIEVKQGDDNIDFYYKEYNKSVHDIPKMKQILSLLAKLKKEKGKYTLTLIG